MTDDKAPIVAPKDGELPVFVAPSAPVLVKLPNVSTARDYLRTRAAEMLAMVNADVAQHFDSASRDAITAFAAAVDALPAI